MVTLDFVFYMFVVLAAIVGALRGWAKELLVAFSVILAIFVLTVLETFVGFFSEYLAANGPTAKFWASSLVVFVLALAGYQTPNIRALAQSAVREKFQDSLLGAILGAVNGYLIIGSIWFYLDQAGYPFSYFISPHTGGGAAVSTTLTLIAYLPPAWLAVPTIYFAVAIAFTFVVIVFI